MTEFQILLDSPSKAGKPIEIARIGTFEDERYGSFSISEADARAWQENLSLLPGNEVLVDRDHASERRPRNSKAMGWLSNIRVSGDRILADARWTASGRRAIRDGSYRFTSVAYGPMDTEDGQTIPNVLQSCALTNRPALRGLAAVTLAQPERVELAESALTLLDVSQADRDQAAKEGNALADGSYPVRNASELHSAAVLAASRHGDWQAAKRLIKRRARELGVDVVHLPGFRGPKKKGKKAKRMDAAPAAVRTLEQRAADRGLVVLDAARVQELEQAAVDRDRDRFDVAFREAVRARKVTPGERGHLARFYQLDQVACLESLAMRERILPEGPLGEPSMEFSRDDVDLADFDGDAAARSGMAPNSILLDQQVRQRLRQTGRPITEYAAAAGEILGAS